MHYDVGVVGLGYVGLTLGTALAEAGLSVLGVEKRADIVELINSGTPHFTEQGLDALLQHVTQNGSLTAKLSFDHRDTCTCYVITVGTPLGDNGLPRLDMIESATAEVAKNAKDGSMVILRSTVMVGTTRNVVKPILDASGKNFLLAMCPERTLEGKAIKELSTLPQIVGADDPRSSEIASKLFGHLTPTIVEVSKYESAEIIKLVDNTYRDVTFGFANEVARICDASGVNAMEVIDSGKLGYERTNVPFPGLVGGPCLEKDPHIFNFSANQLGIELEITKAARQVNERQPKETMDLIFKEASKRKLDINCKICILGIAFKGSPETNDLRGSMSVKLLEIAVNLFDSPSITLFDPVVSPEDLQKLCSDAYIAESVMDGASGSDIVIIANNHPEFAKTSPAEMKNVISKNGFIFDYWNHFSSKKTLSGQDFYYSVGNAGTLGI